MLPVKLTPNGRVACAAVRLLWVKTIVNTPFAAALDAFSVLRARPLFVGTPCP